nr:S41 family peptidase [uncultured Carboxylicivirga sp.]
MKAHFYYIILSILVLTGCVSKSKRIENQVIFAKTYGYVKYFHPSDEAAQLDWDSFAIYGASQIDKCQSASDVIKVLEDLFNPIAPTIQFSSNISDFDTNIPAPDSIDGFRQTYWQHNGVSFGMINQIRKYESRRVNRANDEQSKQLFDYCPKSNECIIKEIGEGIYCQIPIVLYCNDDYTFPQANKHKLEQLNDELQSLKNSKPSDLYTRLGNIVNVYNVFQHFYPYFDVVNVNWETEFKNALNASYSDKDLFDHLITLEKFTASLKDGHIHIYNSRIKQYAPPIAWDWVQDRLIITQVEEGNDSIKVGDVVTQIEGKSPELYFNEVHSRISAATKGYLNFIANSKSLQGDFHSYINIVIEGKKYSLKRTVNYYAWLDRTCKKPRYKEIENGIWYLNLDKVEIDTIDMLLPKLEESKSIICDLRGYPNKSGGFITNLLAIDDTTKSWMQTPQIVYPDQDKIIGYKKSNWIGSAVKRKPYLGDKNVIFIIDGRAISYAESVMGYVKNYNLATIIGQPTAGTNGSINSFSLPGGYKISFTGMKVVKHNGSQLHGIGILPDIYLEKTIKGVKDDRDEFLDKAIEFARNKSKS